MRGRYLYSKLAGKIIEKYGTVKAFSIAMNRTPTIISQKLDGKSPWKSTDILSACKLLSISEDEIRDYFFTT